MDVQQDEFISLNYSLEGVECQVEARVCCGNPPSKLRHKSTYTELSALENVSALTKKPMEIMRIKIMVSDLPQKQSMSI